MRKNQVGIIVLISTMLAACGGGGGSGSGQAAVPATSPVQGVYEGNIASGRYYNTLILENNEYYAMYGSLQNNAFYVMGFVQGTGSANNGSFSSSDLRDFAYNGSVYSGSLSASYQAGVSLNGTISSNSGTQTFAGAPIKDSLYNYNVPANLTEVAGSWSMTDLSGAPVSLSIASSGSFSGSSQGCSFSGTLTPRPSGKNVFNMTVQFGDSPCILANQSASGIALDYLLQSGRRQFIVAGMNSARTKGTALLGSR
jgi:hypothetical protein